MKKAKSPRVPVLENAFEVNLPKLMRMAKATGKSRLVLDNGVVRTAAVLTETRLAVFLGDRQWIVDIVAVQCLKGRLRPLLRCPHAHEGNFQSLYYWSGELACRQCHRLRYRTNLAATSIERARIARLKLANSMASKSSEFLPVRQPRKWRSRHYRLTVKMLALTGLHYQSLRAYLERRAARYDDRRDDSG